MRRLLLLLVVLSAPGAVSAQAGPEPLRPGVAVRAVATGLNAPLRLAAEPGTNALVWLTYDGRLHRLAPPYHAQTPAVLATPAEHGLSGVVQGMTIGPDGAVYLAANLVEGMVTTGIVRRGRRAAGGAWTWETVMRTEPYARSNTPYDHSLSALAVSPDGRWLYVNSGSRTDHGEEQAGGGLFPGLREAPLTSAILRVPADTTDLLLRNDEAFLKSGGYLFADGVRNAFDLAFDAEGRLFGTENAGDRDDNEELNWLREGHHYGFPWRMGLTDTPMRFPGYDPAQDRLLNPQASAVQGGFFYNDPAYPAPPAGVSFTDPIVNRGPDANRYRDPATGAIRDADGQPFATFTSHRSPLGLVFDADGANPGLPDLGRHAAFVLSWTGTESPLLAPFGDEGEDLLFLDMQEVEGGFEVHPVRIVRGFTNPMDAVLVGRTLYVIELAEASTPWAVEFLPIDGNASESPERAPDWHVHLAPEPVTTTARVQVTAPRVQALRVEVRSLLGQREAVLFEGTVSGGVTRTFTLDRTGLAAGVHVLCLVGAHGVQARPFVVR